MKINKFRVWYIDKMMYNPPQNWLIKTGEPMHKIMQFTGICDTNNEEIYEGDIIICHFHQRKDEFNEINGRSYGIVRFDDKYCQYKLFFNDDTGRENWQPLTKNYGHEVIGNMFQNPELVNYPRLKSKACNTSDRSDDLHTL